MFTAIYLFVVMVNVICMVSITKIGSRVRQLRKLRGLTQAQLAEAVGRTMDAVSMIERDRSVPSLETVVALSTALGVSVESVLFNEGNQQLHRERRELLEQASAILAVMSDEQLRIAVEQIAVLGRSPK